MSLHSSVFHNAILTTDFHSFSQFLQMNVNIVLRNRPQFLFLRFLQEVHKTYKAAETNRTLLFCRSVNLTTL